MVTPVLALPTLIAHRAAEDPERTFLEMVDGGSLTYRQFDTEARRWAAALASIGVEPDRQVAVMMPVGMDAALAWLGIGWLRARTVPINIAHRGRMLHYVLSHSAATHLVIADRFVDRLAELEGELPHLTTVVVCDTETPDCPLPVTVVGRDDLLAAATPGEFAPPERWDIAGIFYTSGTTGPSKGVLVPWAQLHATASPTANRMTADDAWYSPMPLSHVSGTVPFYSMALAGARLVIRETFSTPDFLDDVAKYQCTGSLVMGAMTQFLMNQPESPRDRETPLRYIGVSPVPPNIDDFTRRFDVNAFTGYNMTELSFPIVWPEANVNSAKYDSLGKVREGYEVRLVDEHDQEVPVGSVGELIVRADEPWTMNLGYLHMPEATANAWRHGWFHTGDALRRDEDGDYYFVDRLKDTIRRRGENISSAEVEIDVAAHPAVLECAAVAAPSEWGEDEVKVFVVVRPDHSLTPEKLLEFLVGRMAHYMVPRYVEFTDELPKTNTFKVQKHALRERGNSAATWDRVAAGIDVRRSS